MRSKEERAHHINVIGHIVLSALLGAGFAYALYGLAWIMKKAGL